jgi:hypothetical protein
METINDKINEIQASINKLNAIETKTKYDIRELEFLNLKLQAYNELLSFNYTIKIDDNYGRESIILNDVLRVEFNEYRNSGMYDFSVNVDYKNVPSHLKDTKLSPNNISIGKATKKKFEAWIAHAEKLIKAAENYKAEVEARIQESLNTVINLAGLPNVKSSSISSNKTKGYIESKVFILNFEIKEDGYLNVDLNLDRYNASQQEISKEEIFEKLVLVGL